MRRPAETAGVGGGGVAVLVAAAGGSAGQVAVVAAVAGLLPAVVTALRVNGGVRGIWRLVVGK